MYVIDGSMKKKMSDKVHNFSAITIGPLISEVNLNVDFLKWKWEDVFFVTCNNLVMCTLVSKCEHERIVIKILFSSVVTL